MPKIRFDSATAAPRSLPWPRSQRARLVLLISALLLTLSRTAHAQAWAGATPVRKCAISAGVLAVLTTFSGVVAAVVTNAYHTSSVTFAKANHGPMCPSLVCSELRADAHSVWLATRASVWLFGMGATFAGAAVPLALVPSPVRGAGTSTIGLGLSGRW